MHKPFKLDVYEVEDNDNTSGEVRERTVAIVFKRKGEGERKRD